MSAAAETVELSPSRPNMAAEIESAPRAGRCWRRGRWRLVDRLAIRSRYGSAQNRRDRSRADTSQELLAHAAAPFQMDRNSNGQYPRANTERRPVLSRLVISPRDLPIRTSS